MNDSANGDEPLAPKSAAEELAHALDALADKDSELKDVKNDLELVLLQLHQVQGELEYYFDLSREQAKLLALSDSVNDKISDLLCQVVRN